MFAASKSGRSSAGGGTTDPSFAYVPLLLNTTSTNGQQNNTFLDSSSNTFTITRNGTPTQGSITPYWPNGQWSNNFNGSSNLSIASTASLAMGASDFTIEFWVYLRSATNNRTLSWPSVGNLAINCASAGYWNYSSYGVGNILTSSIITPLNTWTHVAISRTGTNTKVFINGAIGASTSSDSNNWGQSLLNIGSDIASNFLNGYLSNLRIVKGTGLYTTAFTPSTTPLTAVTNTVLLTCQSNRFKDNSASPLTITVGNGTPTVQAFQPFSPAASYTTALYGGSGYFNGTSDYLTAGTNAALNPGTGNFTFECWIYLTSTPTNLGIFQGNLNGFAVGFDGSSRLAISQAGVAYLTNDSVAFTLLNQWVHVAVARSGTTMSLYKNGARVATATNSTAFITSTQNYIFSNGTTHLPGYVANLRLINGGTTVYDPTQTTITVPTSPVGNTANTSLLLNMTNAGIYDAAVQNNAITVGDAQSSTTQSKWSPTSMKFDGTGDWLTAIDGPQLQLLTGDFTIDGWFYLAANGVAYGIVSKGTASTGWSVNVTSGNRLQFSYTASNLTGATTTLAATTWYYFAVVRSGSATGNLKIYINGAVEATSGGAVTDNFNQTDILYVGADRIGTSALNGYLQDVRITKAARTITTPTAAFPTR